MYTETIDRAGQEGTSPFIDAKAHSRRLPPRRLHNMRISLLDFHWLNLIRIDRTLLRLTLLCRHPTPYDFALNQRLRTSRMTVKTTNQNLNFGESLAGLASIMNMHVLHLRVYSPTMSRSGGVPPGRLLSYLPYLYLLRNLKASLPVTMVNICCQRPGTV